jgi:hypothetical protein
MDNAELERFVDYYRKYEHNGRIETISHLYEKFGREFIYSLPIKYEIGGIGLQNSVIAGTWLWHSTTEPLYVYNKEPEFYILGYWLTLEQWLPYSALTSEERTLFKLKYG